MLEDQGIKDLKFLDANNKEYDVENLNLYELLTCDKKPLYVRINDNLHAFPKISHEYLKYDLEDLEWFKKATNKGLSATHATTLTAFINQF